MNRGIIHVGLPIRKDAKRGRSQRLDEIRQYAESLQVSRLILCTNMSNHLSLCYREEEREMNKYCLETGVGLIPWAPLYRGYLARPPGSAETERAESSKSNANVTPISDADIAIIKRVQELANKKDWKMSQVALAWIIQRGTIPIVGFSNLSRLDEAADVRGKTLTDEDMKYLEEPYVPKAVVGHS